MESRCIIVTRDVTSSATLSAVGTAPGLGVEHLKTDHKGEVCRFLGTSGQVVATWTTSVSVGSVVIPACNFGPSSTVRVRCYADSAGSVLLEDTGVQYAAPGTTLGNWGFDIPLNANPFSMSGGVDVNSFANVATLVQVHLQQQRSIKRLVLDFTNPDSAYSDLSKLFIGPSWRFLSTADYGAVSSLVDGSSVSRAASGDLRTDWGPRARKLSFELSWLIESDRERASKILAQGVGGWVFASLVPWDEDHARRLDYSIFGKLQQPLALKYGSYMTHSTAFEVDGY